MEYYIEVSNSFVNSSPQDIEIIARINNSFDGYYSDPFILKKRLMRFIPRKGRLYFYPISKNLRMLASSYSKAIAEGSTFRISNQPRRGEVSFVKNTLGWNSWFPWIWVRHLQEDANPLSSAWQAYFDSNFSLEKFRGKKTQSKKEFRPYRSRGS